MSCTNIWFENRHGNMLTDEHRLKFVKLMLLIVELAVFVFFIIRRTGF